MASLIYHTDVIVLDSFDVGETDRIYAVFSKEFGLLRVSAKSIRAQASKLRGHATLFSHSRISFVLGRAYMRLIDAEELERRSFSDERFFAAGRMSRFLLRVIQGEERDTRVWEVVSSALRFLSTLESQKRNAYERDALLSFELLFRARLLYVLGYVGEDKKDIEKLLHAPEWNVSFADNENIALRSLVDKGMRASHL